MDRDTLRTHLNTLGGIRAEHRRRGYLSKTEERLATAIDALAGVLVDVLNEPPPMLQMTVGTGPHVMLPGPVLESPGDVFRPADFPSELEGKSPDQQFRDEYGRPGVVEPDPRD